MTDNNRSGAMLPAARLLPKTSAKDIKYLTTSPRGIRVLVMQNRDDGGDHNHVQLFAEAPHRDGGGR